MLRSAVSFAVHKRYLCLTVVVVVVVVVVVAAAIVTTSEQRKKNQEMRTASQSRVTKVTRHNLPTFQSHLCESYGEHHFIPSSSIALNFTENREAANKMED